MPISVELRDSKGNPFALSSDIIINLDGGPPPGASSILSVGVFIDSSCLIDFPPEQTTGGLRVSIPSGKVSVSFSMRLSGQGQMILYSDSLANGIAKGQVQVSCSVVDSFLSIETIAGPKSVRGFVDSSIAEPYRRHLAKVPAFAGSLRREILRRELEDNVGIRNRQ